MRPWFNIHGDNDHGPYSRWLGFDAKPVVWQGWVLTAVYYAVTLVWVGIHIPRLAGEALAFGSLLLGFLFWHTIVLWLASHHFAKAEG